MDQIVKHRTGAELRAAARAGIFADQTAGQAPGYLQGNVVILPKALAGDFLQFCLNNPKPCPLIGLSSPGDPTLPSLGQGIDIRHDVPQYRVYRKGKLQEQVADIAPLWSDDLVTFVLGCSFTFEEALIQAGYGVRHIELGRNVPMFKSNLQTLPGGLFKGPVVVTMRPYPQAAIPKIFDLCARYPHAHGAPLFWGDPMQIGIKDLQRPDYGDPVPVKAGEIPVFWACGVTPQAAIEAVQPDLSITHAPGYMLVTDVPSDSQPKTISGLSQLTST
ncbi:putative hydro-lyase [Rhodovibrionaceae bacterium A322]